MPSLTSFGEVAMDSEERWWWTCENDIKNVTTESSIPFVLEAPSAQCDGKSLLVYKTIS